MITWWNELDRTLREMDDLRRFVQGTFGDLDARRRRIGGSVDWPVTTMRDDGEDLVLTADVPGLKADDLDIHVTSATLTLKGERKVEAPEGYSVHRCERRPVTFSRSWSLPTRVDPEKVAARLDNGVLTVRLAKAQDARPRQITVQAG